MAKKLIRLIHILLIISLIASIVLNYNQSGVEAKVTNTIYGPEKSIRTALPNTISGRIAFESSREGITEIYIMNPDGSNQVRLTGTDAANCRPIISPDGSKIVFYSFRNGPPSEIYSMNIDGSDQVRLTNNSAYDNCPSWTPDGEKIIFVSDRDGSNNIYIMNKDGTNPVHLTNNTLPDEQPSSWSPDGTRIAYSSMQFVSGPGIDGYEIYTMNFDGSNKTRLTNNLKRDYEPAWSPDGTRIAFTSWRSDQTEVFVMGSDGSNQIKLANGASPSWSPDGTKIAFIQWNNGDNKIYIMNADGSNQTLVTNSAGLYWSPCWGVANGTPPLLGDTSIPNVGTNSADLKSNLTSFGSASDAYVTFQWGKAHSTYTNETQPIKKNNTGSFSISLTNLDPGTTYYFHSKAFRQGTSYSPEKTFMTKNLDGSTGSQASSIALTSSLNPVALGQVVTFTATVKAMAPATGIPGGTVTFQDGTQILGTGIPIASGQASYSTSTLSVGSKSISAVYGGDAIFASSTSSVLDQNIWKRGDANGDGLISMGDVIKVERVILGLDPQTCGCDANGDGLISMGDVTKIERIILGLDPQ